MNVILAAFVPDIAPMMLFTEGRGEHQRRKKIRASALVVYSERRDLNDSQRIWWPYSKNQFDHQ
jgi:hypothetical protein